MNFFKKLLGKNRQTTIVADGGSSVYSARRDVVIANYGHNNGIISAVNKGEISSSFETNVLGENHSLCIKTDVNGNEIAIIDGEKVKLPEGKIDSVQMINGQIVINGWIYKNGEWVKK